MTKIITNNTGVSWSRFANELLDPAGDGNDADDPVPQPGFVPAGFSTSNDNDGLSFAQGSGIARTSTSFTDVFSDELTDARDFIDFFNGTVADGGSDTVSFGLRNNISPANEPFLLVQRPNQSSRDLPVPGTLALVALGLLGLRASRRQG